jgi:cytidylate kinase
MIEKFNIAIDGPAGSGKGTIAKEIAKKLEFNYLDTGAMYRALALVMIRLGVSVVNFDKSLLENIKIDFDSNNSILLNEENVSELIRTSQISKLSSDFSTLKEVREFLVSMQQEIVKEGGYVAEGRDIGSVVISDARVKVYLTASLEERARRRLRDFDKKGISKRFEEVYEELRIRDKQDIEKEFGALIKCDDAVEIDNTNLSIDEQIEKILKLI